MGEFDAALEAPTSRPGRLRTAATLPPVRRRKLWIAAGLAVQLVAVALPVTAIAVRAKHEALSGVALRATVLMVARELFRSPGGIILFAGRAGRRTTSQTAIRPS